MSAAVISMGGRHRPWQQACQTQRPLESPLSLGRGRGAVQAREGGWGHPGVTSISKDQRQGCPQLLWDLPLQSHCSVGLPPAPHCSVSLSPLSFSFSPPPLVSSVPALQRLARPIPQPLSTLKNLPSFKKIRGLSQERDSASHLLF